jgi:toxin ParE1/3/4
MGLIRRTPASYRDYQVIWDYVAEKNVLAADRLLRTLDSKLELLSDHPRAGPARPELRPGLRSFPVGEYLIFYRPIRGGIELLRVLHGARNVRKTLRRRSG